MRKFFTETKRVFLNPIEAATTAVETSSEWTRSRRWLRILPFAPIAAVVVGLYVFGWVRESAGEQERVRVYVQEMDAEYPIAKLETILYRDILQLNGKPLDKEPESSPTSTSESQNFGSRTSQPAISEIEPPTKDQLDKFGLTIKRIEQFSPNNNEMIYRDAVLKAICGKLPDANALITDLVKSTGSQTPAAYHWHAVNLVNQRLAGTNVSEAELNRVLQSAIEWRMARPAIQMIYATQLLKQNKVDQALDLMLTASETTPEQMIAVADLAKRNKRERIFQSAISKAEKFYRSKLDTALESPSDRINFVNTQLLQDRKKVAVEILVAGLNNSAVPPPEFKQKLSDIYLSEFAEIQGDQKSTLKPEAAQVLDKAIEADDSNPQLGSVIASIMASGLFESDKLPKTFFGVLQKQIAANKVAPSTLMMLGGMYYKQGRNNLAETAWQKALEATPNSVQALNNLAVIEFDKAKPNKELALERIQRAFEIAPNDVEVCDSYGQVLLKCDRPKEAIAFFERALRLSPQRNETRKMLADCYAAIGQPKISEAYQALVSTPASTAEQPVDASTSEDAPSAATEPAAASASAADKAD